MYLYTTEPLAVVRCNGGLKASQASAYLIKCPLNTRCPFCTEILEEGIWIAGKRNKIIANHRCRNCSILLLIRKEELWNEGHDGMLHRNHFMGVTILNYHVAIIEEKKREKTDREKLLDGLGAKCVQCGITEPNLLRIDHIFGDGKEDRRMLGGGWYEKYLDDSILMRERLQVLCLNCHWRKTLKNGEWGRGRSVIKI